tara:strand:+ start:42159 stop:43028 length:870 start_codon:yes stop_codon:yes gene_type:complete
MKENILITERDFLILKYLWKWKLLSTKAISIKFFPNSNDDTAYKRMMLLTKAGYLKPRYVNDESPRGQIRQQVWGLNRKGFHRILQYLGELKIKGYFSSNSTHDYLATSLHLGEWLLRQPPDSQTWSEQELNSIPTELWPNWVPKSDLHRPDGFTAFNYKNRRHVLAFEVELHVKSSARYEAIAAYYDSCEEINHVIWLVKSIGNYKSIKKHLNKHGLRNTDKHRFLSLKEFEKHGWNSNFIDCANVTLKLQDLIITLPPTTPRQSPPGLLTLDMLNARKRPKITRTCK